MRSEELLPLTPLSFEILLALADDARHGYGIIKEIESRTGKPLKSSTGTVYLAIQRLEQQALIAGASAARADDGGGHRGRRSRYYRLTELGREVVTAEAERLARLIEVAHHKRMLPSASLPGGAGGRKP